MNGIPEATPIRLMEEERAELLSLARSTKSAAGFAPLRILSTKVAERYPADLRRSHRLISSRARTLNTRSTKRLLSGQYRHPLRVVAFNAADGWARRQRDIARQVLTRASASHVATEAARGPCRLSRPIFLQIGGQCRWGIEFF